MQSVFLTCNKKVNCYTKDKCYIKHQIRKWYRSISNQNSEHILKQIPVVEVNISLHKISSYKISSTK